MKKMMQLATVLGVSVGIFGLASVTASANSQYSAKRSNSVRLVWRTSMKRHAYTATHGARYSKHLGIRYSNNDVTSTVTWYTDAHEKLYKKYKGHNAIYYHVKSADGTLQGWIWRGYLKSVKQGASTNTKANMAVDNSVTLQNAKSSSEYTNAVQTESQYRLANAVWKLFPGTKVNLWLSRHVAYCDQTDVLKAKPTTEKEEVAAKYLSQFYVQNGVNSPAKTQYWLLGARSKAFVETQSQSVSQRVNTLKRAMDNDGMTASKRHSFKGWYIGINVADSSEINGSNPNTDPENPYVWTYGVFLAPADSFQSINNN
ncbi:hypothetical protein [Levilactobacillus brevis]|uniref:hypothetical protein n=1 Tax=Levilactobacillus brevis TaxID=1580 RepID=UPI00057E04C9|nr:hypothetical protein [Levilactobacillus brevis]KID43722.1 hypothetical protein LbDm2_1889 [Levilactobacillus brevis]MCU0200895.1 hypothetical protein [Levilactobacillus brevis]ODP94071.1 hypothetical protein BGC39_06660 [Levilactobacillus brevis]